MEENQQGVISFFFKRNLLNKEICYITDEEKAVKNEWGKDGSGVL